MDFAKLLGWPSGEAAVQAAASFVGSSATSTQRDAPAANTNDNHNDSNPSSSQQQQPHRNNNNNTKALPPSDSSVGGNSSIGGGGQAGGMGIEQEWSGPGSSRVLLPADAKHDVAHEAPAPQPPPATAAGVPQLPPPTALPAPQQPPPSSNEESQDEDAEAHQSLVQFPAYGSRSHAQSQSNLNQTADWLLGGTANIPSKEQLLKQQEERQAAEEHSARFAALEDHHNQLLARSKKQTTKKAVVLVHRDWDPDEQQLWRSSSSTDDTASSSDDSDEQPPPPEQHRGLRQRTTTTTTTKVKPNAVNAPPVTELDQDSQNWLTAYYYHTGVQPKIQMRRPHPLFDKTPTTSRSSSKRRSVFSGVQPLPDFGEEDHEDEVPRIRIAPDADAPGVGAGDHLLPKTPKTSNTAAANPQEEHAAQQSQAGPSSPPAANGEDRQHWMPDQLCKHCYACDTPFTVFRRRHHCRICGQVFCNACSGFFVPAAEAGLTDAPTTAPTGARMDATTTNSADGTPIPTTGSHPATNNPSSTTTTTTTSSSKTVLRACKMCYDQVNEQRRQQQLLLEKKEQEQERRNHKKDETAAGAPGGLPTTAATPLSLLSPSQPPQQQPNRIQQPLSPALQEQFLSEEGDSSVLQSLSKRRTGTSAYAKRRLQSQEEALERDEKEQASRLLQQQIQKDKHQIQQEKTASSLSLGILRNHNPGSSSLPHGSSGSLATLESAAAAPASLSSSLPSSSSRPRPPALNLAGSGSLPGGNSVGTGSNNQRRRRPSPEAVAAGNRELGLCAANHLEQMGKALLASDAPLLYQELRETAAAEEAALEQASLTNASATMADDPSPLTNPDAEYKAWIARLMALATRCCATVEPNVKKGDLLDIRPYVKIKVIPGGTHRDCAYISGVLFRKTVSHKRMAKEITNPSIMLLSGGIEFTRTENRIASLETLMEQENKYIEILVGKILKLKPDILMVGKAVSRRAQELLLEAKVTLLQHVKASLLSRISRQTGATIISSTDHIMNQFGAHVLGRCNRFRIIVARDNEVWVDEEKPIPSASTGDRSNPKTSRIKKHRDIRKLLRDPSLTNPERQAALAANMLGEKIRDGYDAVRSGLAKRGVAQTYAMLEGCPKQLGCTVVLRGASKAALKQVKVVLRFLINAAYNLSLETSYLKERCARLKPDYRFHPENLFSTSLCVDYGAPPSNRKIRPWNGGSNNNEGSQRSMSGQVTAFDHQAILISSVWMTDKTQCCPAEVKGICYYSQQDVSLGQFLRDSCFNLSLKCQNPSCKKSVLDHSLSFVHNDGLINITVDHMDEALPPASTNGSRKTDSAGDEDGDDVEDPPIATWTYCKNCAKVVTPLVYISENTWKYSFGKFLESFFYNRETVMNSSQSSCACQLQTGATLYFGCGRLAARFTYERVRPFGVFVRKSLPIDTSFHRTDALRQLDQISMSSSVLFVKFDKHIEKVSREARALYNSKSTRSDHLQTVLSELNRISSEVDHAAKTLQEKIASVSDKCSKDDEGVVSDALLRFPWFARRYLFMLTSAWNEKLSAAGQAIVAIKKLASSSNQRNDSLVGPNVPGIVGDQNHDELHEGIRRLRQLHEVYSRYNVTDITTVLPIIPGNNSKAEVEYDDDFEDPDGNMDFTDGVDADVLASRRRLYHAGASAIEGIKGSNKSSGTRRGDEARAVREIANSTVAAKVTPGGAVKSAITRFFNRGGRESDPYIVDLGIFSEGRPRLEPGVNGIVVPVIDEQLCTVIAYSLSSTEYANQFQSYAKMEVVSPETPASGAGTEANTSSSDAAGRSMNDSHNSSSRTPSGNTAAPAANDKQGIERRMLVRNKSHIKHTFRDFDEKGQNLCKFVCTTYWATQFQAVRQAFLSPHGAKVAESNSSAFPSGLDVEQAYVQSLSSAYSWAASGGKSGASFARTSDDRFVIKCISRTELQMFLESAPAYFEYLSKAFFHGLPTVLCKIVGVYQIGLHNRVTGKRSMEQVAVMQNIFYNKKITKTFDLKGSLRGRFAAQIQRAKDDSHLDTPAHSSEISSQRRNGAEAGSDFDDSDWSDNDERNPNSGAKKDLGTLLDGDFLEFTTGRPMPMNDRAKAVFHMSILNDTLFLSIINVLDYSILVGIDEERMELVVGIIDFMRQYDILKQMERVGKSLPMVVGSEAPTIIQPPLYKARFTNAMERYFMTVPSKWTTI